MGILTKLSDDFFDGNHPNGIDAGMSWKDNNWTEPSVGAMFYFGRLRTSVVTEIIHNNKEEIKFKTENSTYLLTKED